MRARLRKMRLELGLSQGDMANQLKVDRSTYVRYETGLRIPSLRIALRIAQILDTGVGSLFASDLDLPRKEAPADV